MQTGLFPRLTAPRAHGPGLRPRSDARADLPAWHERPFQARPSTWRGVRHADARESLPVGLEAMSGLRAERRARRLSRTVIVRGDSCQAAAL